MRVDNFGDDSCVVLYWNPGDMKPESKPGDGVLLWAGERQGGKLRLTVGGTLAVNREMTVVAYVAEPKPGEKATLQMPKGFEFLDGSRRHTKTSRRPTRQARRQTQPVPITWRVSSHRRRAASLDRDHFHRPRRCVQRVTILRKGFSSMSFRLFIYYCALCGGWAAFFGWMLGHSLAPTNVHAPGWSTWHDAGRCSWPLG